MSGAPLDRRFSERDAARVLRLAEELQAQAGAAPEGLSPEDVERIGGEMGLDRRYVRAAMETVFEPERATGQTRWLGAPPSYEFERVVEAPVTDEAWHAMVAELNSAFHQSINGETQGPVRTWFWKHGTGSIHLSATEARGSTRLRLVSYIDDGIGWSLFAIIGAMIIGAGFFLDLDAYRPWLGIGLTLLWVFALAWWYRAQVASWYAQDRRKLSRLMDRLEEAVRPFAPQERMEQAAPALADPLTEHA